MSDRQAKDQHMHDEGIPHYPDVPLEFGEDEYHHKCGGEFELRCSAGFTGFSFGVDGYAYSDLDLVWDESELVCLECFYTIDFAAWQEAVQMREQGVITQPVPA